MVYVFINISIKNDNPPAGADLQTQKRFVIQFSIFLAAFDLCVLPSPPPLPLAKTAQGSLILLAGGRVDILAYISIWLEEEEAWGACACVCACVCVCVCVCVSVCVFAFVC